MNVLKLLLVEDSQQDIEACQATIKRYKKEKNREIELIVCRTLDDAFSKLNSSFDGAIIDLRLDIGGDEGNEIVEKIQEKFRIPTVIFTGTPGNADDDFTKYVRVYTKSKDTYEDILNYLFDAFDTGITNVVGGRGILEEKMNKIFWNNLLPTLDAWKTYVSNGKNTEKALLRHTISHLLEILDEEEDIYFPEEMYIIPPISSNIKTGSIIFDKEIEKFKIVLSPACDLVLRKDGNIKTDSILTCLIEKRDLSIIARERENLSVEILDSDDSETAKEKRAKEGRAKDVLMKIARNNHTFYYHYLPRAKNFEGGIIDFRKITAYKPKEFKKFGKPVCQVSTSFTKDIVARFSTYYGRQGQPDFNFNELFDDLSKPE